MTSATSKGDWITALKSASIRKLIDGGQLQLGLFDERNLFELTHPDFAMAHKAEHAVDMSGEGAVIAVTLRREG